MDASLTLGEQHFDIVITRGGGVSVYRGDGRYLRIGSPGKLDGEIAVQRQMLDAGFPVPDLIEAGEYQGLPYVIESSLGPDTLGDRFDAETRATGSINPASFDAFLDVVQRFARAQLTTTGNPKTIDDLRRLARADDFIQARTDLTVQVERTFDRLASQLSAYPGVLTHGDFHAFNVCDRGVIDLETVGSGPAGYDLICAIVMPDLFPPDPLDYRFSPEQRDRYLRMIDDLYIEAELPVPTNYLNEFRLCRAVWLAARRERPTAILDWLDRQCEDLMDAYLTD